MLVTCPNCSSRYQVPDMTLGMKGRTVRCSRCGNQWAQPFVAAQPEARPKRPEARMVTDPPRERRPEPVMVSTFQNDEPEDDLLAAAMRQEESGDASGEPDEDGGNPFDRIAEMMAEQPPAPIPDMFATPSMERRPRRRGTLVLVILAILLVVAVLGGAAYFLQDRLISRVPGAAKIFEETHLRHEVPGAGLEFQSVGADRTTQDGHEALVVRGVIANGTETTRDIPPMRLALYDGPTMVQEKIADPPQPKIDAKGTVSFRITLDLPDPHATRFEVTFGAPAKPGADAMAKPADTAPAR